LQDDVFNVLKRGALKALIDERLDFELGDLNSHGRGLLLSL
jgi:hypothetical protein